MKGPKVTTADGKAWDVSTMLLGRPEEERTARQNSWCEMQKDQPNLSIAGSITATPHSTDPAQSVYFRPSSLRRPISGPVRSHHPVRPLRYRFLCHGSCDNMLSIKPSMGSRSTEYITVCTPKTTEPRVCGVRMTGDIRVLWNHALRWKCLVVCRIPALAGISFRCTFSRRRENRVQRQRELCKQIYV